MDPRDVIRPQLLSANGLEKYRLLQTANKTAVRNEILPWYTTPFGSTETPFNTQTDSKSIDDTSSETCLLSTFDFQNPTEELLNVDNSLDVLYPGSFVQSKYISSGSESLVKVPISNAKRNPIRIAGKGNFAPVWADSSEAGDVHYAIRQAIADSTGFVSSSAYYAFTNATSLTDLTVKLSLNAKIFKKLSLSAGFTGNWKTRRNKMMLTLLQGIASFFPDMVVSDGEPINDAVGVFLKESFGITDVNNLGTHGYMGSDNPPLYVSQVNYGRLIIVTVEENTRTKSIATNISASYGLASGTLESLFTSLFQDSTTKVFSVGPFSGAELSDLKAGTWTNFFDKLPANADSVQSLTPIGFKLRDFKGRPALVTNFLQYDKVTCTPKPVKNIVLRVTGVYTKVTIMLQKTGSSTFNKQLYSGGSSGWINITPELTSGDLDQIRVSNQGGRRGGWIKYSWKRSATLTIKVDGKQVYSKKNSCKNCSSTSNAFTCSVNKITGRVAC